VLEDDRGWRSHCDSWFRDICVVVYFIYISSRLGGAARPWPSWFSPPIGGLRLILEGWELFWQIKAWVQTVEKDGGKEGKKRVLSPSAERSSRPAGVRLTKGDDSAIPDLAVQSSAVDAV
jgi:hypothetical protein